MRRIQEIATQRGCYFDLKSYASARRRVLALAIDMLVILVLVVIISAICSAVTRDDEGAAILGAGTFAMVAYLYFVEFERSRIGTCGFRLMRLEILNLKGARPSRMDMLMRLGAAWLGPLNLLLDLFWIPSDANRQALRDKFAGTYVVRKGAQPIGTAPIRYEQYFLFGFNWAFREVAR